jgi:hypothetical protein
MTNFHFLVEECENYKKNFIVEDEKSKSEVYEILDEDDEISLVWGMTPLESFQKVILSTKRPKRFIVFGCSIGYQCFYFNHLFPDIPCIGIDLMPFRVNWGKSMIEKYQIKGVELHIGNITNFQPKDGDLIWQNNLLFGDDFVNQLNSYLFENNDVEIVSYKPLFKKFELFERDDHHEFLDRNGQIKIIKKTEISVKTSWTEDQNIFYYWRYNDNNSYGVDFIKSEFIIPEKYLRDYDSMNFSKRFVKSEELKLLYNKYNCKLKFSEFEFNVPELYFYSKDKCDLTPILSQYNTFVAKPAHFSESVDVYIKKNTNHQINLEDINENLNKRIDISDKGNWRRDPVDFEIDWKDTERGILVEEYINVIYELKVFVVFGEPIVGDLRTGSTEFYTVDFIKKENSYLNWDREYDLLKKFAESLKIDFIRIDFLYDGNKLYASELAFMPGTFLPSEIKDFIGNKLRMPYLRYYYPNLC